MVLTVERHDRVALVVLDRPDARNAMSSALIIEVRRAFAEIEADPQVRATVLTGADPAFCAGFDLRELARTGIDTSLVFGVSGPLGQLRKPVVGAINGPAYSGGLEVALACDLRIASDRALFADTHVRVGVMPGWGLTVRLPEAVGQVRALEMSLAGRKVDADQALEWGLVSQVVPHDELRSAALDIARAVAEVEPEAAVEVLRMYRTAAGKPVADAMVLESLMCQAWIAQRGHGTN